MPVLFEKDTHEVIAKIKNQYPERYQRLKEKYLWC